jgi:predicted RND superfamily exporter protein
MKHAALQHPGRWLWLLLLIPVGIGLARLRMDTEVFELLPSNLRSVEGLKIYQKYFSNARELVVAVQSPDGELTENAAKTIAEQLRPMSNEIASVTWEPPWLEHPEDSAELVAYLWFNQPPSVFNELTNRLAPQRLAETLQNTREQLAMSLSPEDIARSSYDPFGLTRLPESASGAAPSFAQGGEAFASADGKFRLVFIQSAQELQSYPQCERWLNVVRPAVSSAIAGLGKQSAEVKVQFTGRPMFVVETALGMKHDITTSVGGTAAFIAILFWIAHRRVVPMLWLLALLALILGATLALGGLIYGTINAISLGFAAILLGLAVDYAVVHYQEALAHPVLSIAQIRHAIAPAIFWAAVTTISAFLVLNFGGLPGLGQLGTLVGLGVALSATIMIFEYLPPLFPNRKDPKPDEEVAAYFAKEALTPHGAVTPTRRRTVFIATALVLVFGFGVLIAIGLPRIDSTANALRPRESEAYDALDKIQHNLTQRDALWLIVGGKDVSDVGARLDQVQGELNHAESNNVISGALLPVQLWPRPQFQNANRATAARLASEGPMLRQAALTNGFGESALGLTDLMLQSWRQAAASEGVFWPTNRMSRWIFNKMSARSGTNLFALGLVYSASNSAAATMSQLESELPKSQVWLSSWEMLGQEIFSRVKANMWKVVTPMIILVLLSLFMAFHRTREISLSLIVLVISGACLLAVMRLAGWSWNLLNLMAIPLILGTGVDYSIFMQLALRRYNGDLVIANRAVGKALLLCGGTAVAAFASLAFSSNAGMASLGEVCAIGIGCNMLIAVFLLPVWWQFIRGKQHLHDAQNAKRLS